MRACKVRCHEISAHGLWFFWPDVPDFERAMISLGSERDPIFVRAEIVQSKAVFMHKEVQVLVADHTQVAKLVDKHYPEDAASFGDALKELQDEEMEREAAANVGRPHPASPGARESMPPPG